MTACTYGCGMFLDTDSICERCRGERQVSIFSATMSGTPQILSQKMICSLDEYELRATEYKADTLHTGGWHLDLYEGACWIMGREDEQPATLELARWVLREMIAEAREGQLIEPPPE